MIYAPSLRVGPANFTTVEDIPPGEEVLVGTFFFFEHPIIILFDFGALHDFMSLPMLKRLSLLSGLQKYHIPLPLELIRRVFPTSLIILEGQGIDVILGMN
jgi:hypothetical protein